MAFTITLGNTIFDRQNDNVLLYNSKIEAVNDFKSKSKNVVVIDNINFDCKNIIKTSICVRIPDGISILQMLNYNYCIVENLETNDILCYFINESTQDSGNQIFINMQIDVWTTYIIDILNGSDSCQGLISRTHLDRITPYFVDYTMAGYTYNFGKDSPLFEREKLQNFSKRTSRKERLMTVHGGRSDIDTWLYDNVSYWLYCYMPAGDAYKYYSRNTEYNANLSELEYRDNNDGTRCGLACVCIPILKAGKKIQINDGSNIYTWDIYALREFLRNNNGYARVKALKMSILSPFHLTGNSTIDWTIAIADNILSIQNQSNSTGDAIWANNIKFVNPTSSHETGIAIVEYQDLNNPQIMRYPNVEGLFQNVFSKEYLQSIGIVEPKIYNEDYTSMRLNFAGTTYDLPASKSNDPTPKFYYYEALTPDITKFYLSYMSNEQYPVGGNPLAVDERIFNVYTEKDWTGMIGTIDLSLWYTVDGLDNYLASNKNNLQIFQNKQSISTETAIIGALGNMAKGAFGGAVAGTNSSSGSPWSGYTAGLVGGAISGIANLGSTGVQQYYENQNYNLTMDNMRQSPDSLSAVNSNSVFLTSVDELGIYIELQQPLSYEMDVISDYLKIYGYTYNKVDDIRNYVKTRKYYNYIQAQLIEVGGDISELVRDLIKDIFAKGIRIWHPDYYTNIDFKVNNIERSVM